VIRHKNHIDLFADDTTFYQHLNSENRQNVIKSLQRDLDTIKIWAESGWFYTMPRKLK
jgi:hypothetical protein